MTIQTQLKLNAAQSCIYTRTNISRAYQDFDDSEIAGIYVRADDCIVVRCDGSEQTYSRELIKATYSSYTHRLKDFFSYLGPNYRGPSIWHNNAYILFKGWNYSHALGHLTSNAKLKRIGLTNLYMYQTPTKPCTSSNPIKRILDIWLHQTDCGFRIGPLTLTATWKLNNPSLSWLNLGVRVSRISVSSATYLTLRPRSKDSNPGAFT